MYICRYNYVYIVILKVSTTLQPHGNFDNHAEILVPFGTILIDNQNLS